MNFYEENKRTYKVFTLEYLKEEFDLTEELEKLWLYPFTPFREDHAEKYNPVNNMHNNIQLIAFNSISLEKHDDFLKTFIIIQFNINFLRDNTHFLKIVYTKKTLNNWMNPTIIDSNNNTILNTYIPIYKQYQSDDVYRNEVDADNILRLFERIPNEHLLYYTSLINGNGLSFIHNIMDNLKTGDLQYIIIDILFNKIKGKYPFHYKDIINVKDVDNETILQSFVHKSDEIEKIIDKHPIDINNVDIKGNTLLHSYNESIEFINHSLYIIEKRADPNVINKEGFPASFIPYTCENDPDIIDKLEEYYNKLSNNINFDPNLVDHNGNNIIFNILFVFGDVRGIENRIITLLDNFSSLDVDVKIYNLKSLNAIGHALYSNKDYHFSVIKKLFDMGVDEIIDKELKTNVLMECSNSESNIIELIKFKDFDLNQIDVNHDTILHRCMYDGNYRTTKIIIDYSEKIGRYKPYERRNINHKLNFNYIQPNGISYLMYFLLYGTRDIKPKIFIFLLDKANINVLTSKNKLYGNIFHMLIKMKYEIESVPKDINVQIIRKKLKDESLFTQLFLYDENYNQQTVFMLYLHYYRYEKISSILQEINNFSENPFDIKKADRDGNTVFHYIATLLTREFHDNVTDLYYKYFKEHKEYKNDMKIKNKNEEDFFRIITNSKNNYLIIKFSELL
jgi:hypothetical protein